MPKKTQPKTPDFRGFSFEEALVKLDETVRAMEAGGLRLDDATRLYEEGMSLARVCSEMLASAELKITRIQTAYGEQMRFVGEDEDEDVEE